MKYSVELQRQVTYTSTVIVEATSVVEALKWAEERSTADLSPFERSRGTKYTAVKVTAVTDLNPSAKST